jgi:hypothetical protein
MLNSKTFSDISNGALSSSMTVFITQPLQVIRTSMMVTYKDNKVSSMSDVFKKIKQNEGLKGFYRGFSAALLKTTVGSAIYFGFLEGTKDCLRKHHIELDHTNCEISNPNNAHKHNVINFISSGLARGIQTTLVNPILVVRTRYEVVGFNSYNSILDALIKIKKEEGWRGYLKGLRQTLIKDVPSSAIFYSLYEFFKKLYQNTFHVQHLQLLISMASITTNTILIFLTNPLDVIRARLQYLHYSKNSHHNYTGTISGIVQIAKEEGVRGLCVGIVPRFIKKASASIMLWTTYETLKLRSQKKREVKIFEENEK